MSKETDEREAARVAKELELERKTQELGCPPLDEQSRRILVAQIAAMLVTRADPTYLSLEMLRELAIDTCVTVAERILHRVKL